MNKEKIKSGEERVAIVQLGRSEKSEKLTTNLNRQCNAHGCHHSYDCPNSSNEGNNPCPKMQREIHDNVICPDVALGLVSFVVLHVDQAPSYVICRSMLSLAGTRWNVLDTFVIPSTSLFNLQKNAVQLRYRIIFSLSAVVHRTCTKSTVTWTYTDP